MLSKISVRGDGSPRDMVFHASKPSTGMGFCGSNVPPNYKTKQMTTMISQLNRQITQVAQANACARLYKNVRTLNLLQKQKSVRMSLARVSRPCVSRVCSLCSRRKQEVRAHQKKKPSCTTSLQIIGQNKLNLPAKLISVGKKSLM